jgi:hypothetical protein
MNVNTKTAWRKEQRIETIQRQNRILFSHIQ